MPRTSKRQLILGDLESFMKLYMMGYLLDSDDEQPEDNNSKSLQTFLDMYEISGHAWCDIWNRRYLGGHRYRIRQKSFMSEFWEQPEDDFRPFVRVNKDTFQFILTQIQGHEVFNTLSRKPQLPVQWQLYVALDRMGHDGNGIAYNRARQMWGIGHGTIHTYTKCVVKALLAIEGDWVYWHNAAKRCTMSQRMEVLGFKDCVGFVDGTSFPLHRKPAEHQNIFMNRKYVYSVNSQVVIDDTKRIVHFMVGDPGNAHDAYVFSASSLVTMLERCFSTHEYLIGDSAYTATNYCVPAYKERQRDDPSDPTEPKRIEAFNTYLAKAHVRNEHAIGILKGRWRCLIGMRIDVNDLDDTTRVVDLARACTVLHNMCLKRDPWTDMVIEQDQNFEDPVDDPVVVELGRRLSEGQQKRQSVRLALEAHFARLRRRGIIR